MKKFLLSAIASAAVFAAPAHALSVTDVVYADGYQKVWISTTDVPLFSNQVDGAGALFVSTVDPTQSFIAYCVELTQNFANLPGAYTEADFGAKQADLTKAVQWMLNNDTFNPDGAVESALNQSIIWEIIYENSGTYGFGTGDFQISNSAVAGASTLAFDFGQLDGVVAHATIAKLENGSNQDLLVVTAVPEPSTYALMLAGLAGVGFLARRRRAD